MEYGGATVSVLAGAATTVGGSSASASSTRRVGRLHSQPGCYDFLLSRARDAPRRPLRSSRPLADGAQGKTYDAVDKLQGRAELTRRARALCAAAVAVVTARPVQPYPSYPPHLSGPPMPMVYSNYAPADQGDQVIMQEAAAMQLALDGKEEASRANPGLTTGLFALLARTHTAERVRVYRVLAWSYTQPYSRFAQLPGEHVFILRGALPRAVEVLPPSKQWRRPRFWISLVSVTILLLFLYGAGLLVPPLMILLFPPWAQYRSPDPTLAKWLGAQPAVKMAVSATKFGWLGLLGTGGWKLLWVIQLYSLGDGTSRLVIKAPDVGRVGLMHWRVGFGQAAAIARAIQSVLPLGSFAPPQSPLQAPWG